VLTEIKNRGVEDVCLVVCDGLKGLPEPITTTWSSRRYRPASSHLIRNTFRYAGRQDWDELTRDLRPVYTAVNTEMAAVRFEEFADKWATRYPAIIKLWVKCLYLVTRSLDPTGRGKTRWAIRWKPALNAFAITFEGRILPSIAN
jgi:putative transposase